MNTNDIARIAALLGEPARTAMLLQLMDGRALTANELARAGNVSAQTASGHLSKLVQAGLLTVQQQGRHRYHRLASHDVAGVLEGIMQLAGAGAGRAPQPAVVTGPRDDDLRRARTCYDHIAGRLGVAIADHLQEVGAVDFDGDGVVTHGSAQHALASLGVWPLGVQPKAGWFHCRPCLDWSERRPHVAGRLGALICAHCLEAGWLRKPQAARTAAGTRALQITPLGARHLGAWLGAQRWQTI
ncbi:MAG: helix-turn-helix transcriptional regulator [Rhodoferax sp.]|nr:helix-turn-helix transcriptional regulator [Rhodoferax sp.]HQX59758.1 helix-turn-helix transcriptional regulator [Burkholderiaceae bacterium]